MGIVHAKEGSPAASRRFAPPQAQRNYDQPLDDRKELNLSVPARVDRIHFEGIDRTKSDLLQSVVKDIFTAGTFQDVLYKTHTARVKMDTLSLFRNISVYIDVSRGPKSTPDGLEVTFEVKELKRVVGGVTTEVGENEGSLVVGLRAPNILGRGEKVQTEYSYGSRRSNNFNVTFMKPFIGKYNPALSASIFKKMSEWPTSGYKQLETGLILDYGINSLPLLKHNFQYEACIRNLGVLSKNSSFDVREESGTTLKSSIHHILSTDLRDEAIFPTGGTYFSLNTELAGLGGNVGFLKNDIYLQTNVSVIEAFVLQATLSGGFMTSYSGDKKINICDMFYLGGPLSLRGFKARGIGPQSDGNALGSLCYYSAGLHMYTPLPFRPGKGSFGDLFRTHFFVNAGNVGNPKGENFVNDMINSVRVSAGLGIALRLGQIARIEVNYCFPIKHEQDDRVNSGVQFGIGVQFV